MPAPRAPEREVDEPLAMTWSPGRVAAVIVVLALVVFWAWIFAGGPRKANPDYLDDREFAAAAERRCTALRDDLTELPPAEDARTAADRAVVLARANVLLGDMIDDIEAIAPRSGDDATRASGWLADYRTYLSDREAYATALERDPNAQLVLTENARLSDGVDKTIQIFTQVNDIPDCDTPGDVG